MARGERRLNLAYYPLLVTLYTKKMDQKLLSPLKILLAAFVVFAVILTVFLVGYFFGSKEKVITSTITGKPIQNTFEAGWQAARQKLEQSGLLRPEPEEIFTLSGTITAVSKNQISLKANPTVLNPLADQAPEMRTVTVTSETKIIKLTPKTSEEIAKEAEDFREAMSSLEPGTTPPTPPSPYTEEEIKITDLKNGDVISVTSDTNIKMAAKFVAKEIRLNVSPTIPEQTAPQQP